MTGNVFFDAVIIFLIAYAILSIFYELTDWLKQKYAKCKVPFGLVFLAKHADIGLECGLRSVLSVSCNLRCGVLVVTDGLDEEEELVLWRLTEDNGNVRIVPKANLSETDLYGLILPQ